MSLAKKFNIDVLQIWKKYHNERTLIPAQYPEDHFRNGLKLLMLGMNPSFGGNWIQNRISKDEKLGKENSNLVAAEVYEWHPETGPRHAAHVLEIENHAFKNFGVFFDPQKRFAEAIECDDSYSHMDLFHVRRTNMAQFVKMVEVSDDLTEFGKDQIELTRRTIFQIRPTVVVIANATASKMAVKYLQLEYVENSKTQCTLPGLPETRFFLAGMLSGVRAMDTFSRIRLQDEVRSYMAM